MNKEELLLEEQRQTRNLLKEMADGYEKEIQEATLMQKKKFMKAETVERLRRSLQSESTRAHQWSCNASLIRQNGSLAQSTVAVGGEKEKEKREAVRFEEVSYNYFSKK